MNRAFAVFALESTAVHVTAVRPILKKEPECSLQIAATEPSTASFAVTT
jgi:hypothetical protein